MRYELDPVSPVKTNRDDPPIWRSTSFDDSPVEAVSVTYNFKAVKLTAPLFHVCDRSRIGFDAVTVSTPDHHHFPAAMMAVQRGKHVYVEKPLTHSVGEARALREAAKKKGIISQMGNQGRATEGIRLMKEWVNAGVIGEVK